MVFPFLYVILHDEIKKERMNYEELLATKSSGKQNLTHLPIGDYYRTQIDEKYRGIIKINPQLHQQIVFTKALQKECQENGKLSNVHQLHFAPSTNEKEISQLDIEIGTYLSFEQLLNESPAVVAQKGFIDEVMRSLVDITTYLHQQGIYHVCFSPRTVFVRKGDHAVKLLSHGSYYLGMKDQQAFYGSDAEFVAPEVLNGGTVDERCDVYSIGKFMSVLFERAEMPLEYKQALKKATSTEPEGRFQTPEEMLKSLQKRRQTKNSVISLVVACAIALVCLAVYFDIFPESHPVEFVKPAPENPQTNPLDEGFDPSTLGAADDESVSDSADMAANDAEYQAKAEQIFRKRYEKEADRILSKIYNKDYMNVSEKKFMADNQATLKELMEVQQQLGEEASLTPERSQLIASEIIERITNEKKRQLGSTNARGIQK